MKVQKENRLKSSRPEHHNPESRKIEEIGKVPVGCSIGWHLGQIKCHSPTFGEKLDCEM